MFGDTVRATKGAPSAGLAVTFGRAAAAVWHRDVLVYGSRGFDAVVGGPA